MGTTNFDDIQAASVNGAVTSKYLGQVATRSFVPSTIATGFKSGGGETIHRARDRITAVQVQYANWYCSNSVHEAGSGGTLEVNASIQYPIGSGVWQSFKWSGALSTGVIADGATSTLSDALNLAVPIPAGAAFLLRWHGEASNQLAFFGFSGHNTALTQGFEGSATPAAFTDKTTNGAAFATSAGSNNLYPVAIVGQTARPSVISLGDSRVNGVGDTADATGDFGDLFRSLSSGLAYISAGVPSESLTGFLPASARRAALAQYVSHIHSDYGINDILAGRSAAQVQADIASFIAMFPGKKLVWNTIYPTSTSSDSWATVANQTVSGSNAQRILLNAALRAGRVPGISTLFDTASLVESGPDSGKFDVANGQAITADGIHLNYYGYQQVVRSSLVSPPSLVRSL